MYKHEEERSRVMGYVLGGIAVGVLIGYPLGGILFDFCGESAPFILISFAVGMLLGQFQGNMGPGGQGCLLGELAARGGGE